MAFQLAPVHPDRGADGAGVAWVRFRKLSHGCGHELCGRSSSSGMNAASTPLGGRAKGICDHVTAACREHSSTKPEPETVFRAGSLEPGRGGPGAQVDPATRSTRTG